MWLPPVHIPRHIPRPTLSVVRYAVPTKGARCKYRCVNTRVSNCPDPRLLAPASVGESAQNLPLALDLVQMLWDRSEPDGYAHRMTTNSLPNTPQHEVLMDRFQAPTWRRENEPFTLSIVLRNTNDTPAGGSLASDAQLAALREKLAGSA